MSFAAGLFCAGVTLACCSIALKGQQSPSIEPAEQHPVPSADATQPAVPPIQTPGEIYKAAMRPLDIVRGSLDNWSDSEVGALAVGMHKAHDACEAARPEEYAGDDLYDLARLCALGQDWTNANRAALAYVASRLEKHRAQAYALSVNALVHMNAIDLAAATTREMLLLPYDAEVAYAIRYMKDNLEENSSPAAVELAKDEHQAIVAALSEKAPLKATQGDAVMSLSALYDSAMELAFWQRYAGDADGATTTVTEIDSALPPDSPMLAGDVTQIAAVRLRYGLLGAKMPKLEPMRSLESTTAKAATAKSEVATGDGALTVLVLFPDWCGGCRKMMKPLTEFAKANKETRIRAFGLVFLDDSVIPSPAGHEQLLKELKGTSTLVVPPSTVQTLGANEFPLGVVLDREGRVRFIGVLPVNGFNGDGYVEKTILRIVGKDQGGGSRGPGAKKD